MSTSSAEFRDKKALPMRAEQHSPLGGGEGGSNLREEIIHKILDKLKAQDLASLVSASSHASGLVGLLYHSLICIELGVHGIIAPSVFLQTLSSTKSIVFGKATLRVIHHDLPPADLLEVAVQEPDLSQLLHYLQVSEHFSITSETRRLPDGIAARLGYRCFEPSRGKRKWDRVIVLDRIRDISKAPTVARSKASTLVLFVLPKNQPVLSMLLFLPSTALMNFFYGYEYVCLYAQATWNRVSISSLPSGFDIPHDTPAPVFEELTTAGFVHYTTALPYLGQHRCGSKPACPDTIREWPGPGCSTIILFDKNSPRTYSETKGDPPANFLSPIMWRLRSSGLCGSKNSQSFLIEFPDDAYSGYSSPTSYEDSDS
ncbi:hypothetical protein BKA70DRAFT_1452841 [Coprinopsis sp. MPI-PUGE-AT-0042]|nr:hypothetical protein BKA70DRAFT_1452841 [Coprinopsis sp. MPI-PUGE-AT-0042]